MNKIFLFCSIVVLFITCKQEQIPNTLEVSVFPENGGVVTPARGAFDAGAKVTIKVTPAKGFIFKKFEGDCSDTLNPVTITMSTCKSIVAVFEELDTDGDGVSDNMDLCEDTPEGESVNQYGCSYDQGDSDGDGVINRYDLCSNTPAGEQVDENGCTGSQKTYIPDNNFEKALIELGYDNRDDGYVVTDVINKIKTLELDAKSISNLQGIKEFVRLETLICSNNNLSELDLHHNKSLILLDCSGNQLQNLDLSTNHSLEVLRCSNNNFESLDISKYESISSLQCDNNNLSTLVVNNSLYLLNCAYNNLSDLDLKGSRVVNLDCSSNMLTNLDVSKIDTLNFLSCSNNQIYELDISKNLYLRMINCSYNLIEKLDVTNNWRLLHLNCSGNQLASIDVSFNDLLNRFDCRRNPLSCIRVSQAQIDNLSGNWRRDFDDVYSLECN